jgi:hypothetical protein
MSTIPLALSDELDQILYETGCPPKPSFENLCAWEVDGGSRWRFSRRRSTCNGELLVAVLSSLRARFGYLLEKSVI